MKKNIYFFMVSLLTLAIPTNHAFGQWGTNGANIYNTNSGKLGLSPTGNFTTPTYQIDCKGDINLYNSTDALRLNGNKILWHGGNATDIFLGVNAGNSSMTGHYNTLVGYNAGVATTSGEYNTIVGSNAGIYNTTGSKNVFMGELSGYNNTTGSYNVFMGFDAGTANTIGARNIFLGYYSGSQNTTAANNVALGYNALYTQSYSNSGSSYDSYNVAVGNYALYSNQPTLNDNGIKNTAVGYNSGYSNTTGYNNLFLGFAAGYSNTTAINNMFAGYNSGYSNTTGTQNIFSGSYSGFNNTTGSNNVFTGYYANINNTTGEKNVGNGAEAGYYNVTGSRNTITGYQAGKGSNGNSYNYNCFYGYQAGYSNTADGNTFIGYSCGTSNTSGTYNTFLGYSSGASNTTTGYNTYVGWGTGNNATSSINTFMGYAAGYQTTSGGYNTFLGTQAGYNFTTGTNNVFTGYNAGNAASSSTGSSNTGIGNYAGNGNTSGSYNSYLGNGTGQTNTTGSNNTFVGYGANANAGNYSNATAIGNGATTTATHMMYLGNASTVIYCASGQLTGSDGRFKTNVTENVKGLEFIKKLRPVTYNMNTNMLDDFLIQNMPDSVKTAHKAGIDFTASSAVIHSGFIAQEVEQAAQEANFSSSIVHAPDNESSHYAVNYAQIVVPLVKAVQELNTTVDSLKTENNVQDSINTALQQQLDALTTLISSCCQAQQTRMSEVVPTNSFQTAVHSKDVELSNKNIVVLDQNVPNPFADQTVINYYLPDNTVKAQMIFLDQSGKLIKVVDITEKGKGQLNVFANDLSNGIYTYSLIVDGKTLETKKMVKQ